MSEFSVVLGISLNKFLWVITVPPLDYNYFKLKKSIKPPSNSIKQNQSGVQKKRRPCINDYTCRLCPRNIICYWILVLTVHRAIYLFIIIISGLFVD